MAIHKYEVKIQWEGNTGTGTSSYRSYKRDFSIQHPQKTTIQGSSDPAYLGMRPDGTQKIYWLHQLQLAISFGIYTYVQSIIFTL